MNEQESLHYINLDNGHFLFDLNTKTETDLLEPNYSCSSNHFTIEKSSRFLDASKSRTFFKFSAFHFDTHTDTPYDIQYTKLNLYIFLCIINFQI
ncbi:hypothetical protein CAJAP_01552 [Camponotus japonicus]